jgi:glycosyltransferase involved in cell wall biosynthesis
MKISVAICTYNGEKYLADQLQSIFEQTYPVNEVVICDDGSTDNTLNIINELNSRNAGIIQLFINKTNLGGKKNFEKAFALTTGDIIFFSDQDDYWQPNKVATMVSVFQHNTKTMGVFSDAFLINSNKHLLEYSFLSALTLSEEEKLELTNDIICRYILSYGNIVAGSMLAVRKECKEEVLPFKMLDKMWHDEWIALVLSSQNKLTFVNEKLISYRLHEEQQIGIINHSHGERIKSLKRLDKDNNLSSSPLTFFNHAWYSYKRIESFDEYIPYLRPKISIYRERFFKAKNNLLHHHSFFKRKTKLIKWWICKEYYTSLNEVFFSK